MEIGHRGLELAVTEITLDCPNVDSGFQEMGGIGVTQGVNRSPLSDSGPDLCFPKGSLDTVYGHRSNGLRPQVLPPAQDRRQPFFGRCLDDFQQVPVALDDMEIEELECRVATCLNMIHNGILTTDLWPF